MNAMQFDITFQKLPCAWTSLDAMDISGEMQLDVVQISTLQCAAACWHCSNWNLGHAVTP